MDVLDGPWMFVWVKMRENTRACYQLIFEGLTHEGSLVHTCLRAVVNGLVGKNGVIEIRNVSIGHAFK